MALSGAKGWRQRRVSDEIRLLLADVDGALVTQDKILTGSALEAARALGRAGILLAITSGRPPRGMKMLIGPLGLTTPVAGFNGGALVTPTLDVIESHQLDADTARKAVELIETAGLDAWLYTAEDWMIRDLNAPHVAREAWTVKFDASVVDAFPGIALDRAVKVVGVSDDLERVAACEREVQGSLGDKASAARSQPYYLDTSRAPRPTRARWSGPWRGAASGLSPTAIATIGDQMNEHPDVCGFRLLSRHGQRVSDEVKAKASEVTDTNEDEGFAKAVERFILPRAPKVTDRESSGAVP